jgi:ribonucleoside-diphosphate reductase alpha chain
MRNLYDGVPMDEVYKASILAARTLIEKGPRLHLRHRAPAAAHHLQGSAGPRRGPGRHGPDLCRLLPQFIKKGVDNELLDEKLLQYDLKRLGAALKAERDLKFDYLGLQTLYDRYFLHVRKPASSCPRPSSCAWPWAWR